MFFLEDQLPVDENSNVQAGAAFYCHLFFWPVRPFDVDKKTSFANWAKTTFSRQQQLLLLLLQSHSPSDRAIA